MSYPRCAAVAAVAAFGGLLHVVSVAAQVSTNKINPSPPAAPPQPPTAPCCWFIPIAAVDLADVVVALPVTPCDRTAQNNSVLSPKLVHMVIKQ
jgi:hypothetical protein